MTGYIRQDISNNISNGSVIDADDLDAEFDALATAFNASTGHTHDGTSAEGAPITVVGPAQDVSVTSGAVLPKTTNVYDLGSSLLKWKDLHVQGNILVSGNVDGRDVSVDGTKLDGIEVGATADQTAGEIKTAYESNADTNAFTDAEKTKLVGIESGATADQTAGEIKTAYESNANTNAFTDAEKTKLTGIEAGAEVNQNAFATVAVSGQSSVVADAKTDTLTLSAGTGISLTTNAGTDTVTFTNSAPDQVVSLTGSGATSISGTYPNFTVSSTDTNTTYTAGSGLSLVGTTFSHADTSSAVNLDTSGAQVVDLLSFDTFGHVTNVSTRNLTVSDLGVTASTAELNLLDGVTTSTAELNFVDGVTSNIQTQLNAKAPLADPTFTGSIVVSDTAPEVVFIDTNGSSGLSQTAIVQDGNKLQFETRNSSGVFVGRDYVIEKASSGAGTHIFYLNNTERFRIAATGAFGLNGENYGTSGQFLTSGGIASPPSWTTAPTPNSLSTASGSAPSYSARAWVNFNGTGTVAIRASGNVSSITRVTTGQFTLNFSTAMPDVNYIVVGGGGAANANTVMVAQPINDHPPATTSFRFNTYFGNNSIVDTDAVFVAIFR